MFIVYRSAGGNRLTFLPFFLLCVVSCRKHPLSSPAPIVYQQPNPCVSHIVSRINNDAHSLKYISDAQLRLGVLNWKYAIASPATDKIVCLVPLKSDNDKLVIGFCAIEANALSLRFKFYSRNNWEGNKLQEPDRIIRTCAYFDYLISGLNGDGITGILFKAPDSEQQQSQRMPVGPGTGATNRSIEITNCYEWFSCTGNGKGDCVGNIFYHRECATNYLWVDDQVDFQSEDLYEPGGSGAGAGTGDYIPVVEPPSIAIPDIRKYLACFDITMPAKISVYVKQPHPGSDEPVTVLGGIGHVFVAIDQMTAAGEVRRVVGFHPSKKVSPFGQKQAASLLSDDSGRGYDVLLTRQVGAADLAQCIEEVYNFKPVYDMERYNCADFALDVAAAAGVTLPRTTYWWLLGSGRTPGQLGEDLRKQPDAVKQKGTAAKNTGFCN